MLFDDAVLDRQTDDPSLLHIEEQKHQPSTSCVNSVIFGTSAEQVVEEIRHKIEQKTNLTASAGNYIYILATFTVSESLLYISEFKSSQNIPNAQIYLQRN